MKKLTAIFLALCFLAGCTAPSAETPVPTETTEVTVTPTATPEPTPPEDNRALVEFLKGLTAEEIGKIDWYSPAPMPTEETIAVLVSGALAHQVEHDPLTMNGSDTDIVWSVGFFIGEKDQSSYSWDDMVNCSVGLQENIVEIAVGKNLPAGRIHVKDETLYQFIRTSNDTPDGGVDQEAYERHKETVDEYLADNTWSWEMPGVTVYQELIGFYTVQKRDDLGAQVWRIVDVYRTDPVEKAPQMLAGGNYVDSQLRIHPVSDGGFSNLLVTVDGEVLGLRGTYWLMEEGGLEQYTTVEELRAEFGK